MDKKNHFTTRRGFIAASGFGGVSLYGLWAAYGAAPGPLALLGLEHPQAPSSSGGHSEHGAAAPEAPAASAGGHAGHGAAAVEGSSAEEFSRLTAEFAERYRMPDGSVYPRRMNVQSMAAMDDPHAGHNMPADTPTDHVMSAASDPHAGHGAAPAPAAVAAAPPAGHATNAPSGRKDQAIDVLMTAGRWYYLPNLLRLDAGQTYRFKMMSVDIAHGASIQLGKAGRMMRLQPGRITEAEITFQKPGRYLMYCTVYCGEAHGMMQATIEVV
jgi:heme/copper-type cytochrome/quinol oxidase subunit 2